MYFFQNNFIQSVHADVEIHFLVACVQIWYYIYSIKKKNKINFLWVFFHSCDKIIHNYQQLTG